MPQSGDGWEHGVAGGLAGSTAVLLLHPFDVVKTRLQVQDGHQGQLLGSYKGSLDAVRTILRREGWRAFCNGLVPAWVGSGVSWSAYFTFYEGIKGMYTRDLAEGQRPPPWVNTVSAAQAGAMVCLLTNPIWLVKTRLQLQNSTLDVRNLSPTTLATTTATTTLQTATGTAGAASTSAAASVSAALQGSGGRAAGAAGAAPHMGRQYRGFVDALVSIGRTEGIRGYYKGLTPSLVLTTHGAIQFTVYEELKHIAARWGTSSASDPDRRITSAETSVAAAASKLAASVITYPSQLVRSRLQQRFDLGRTRSYRSTWEVIKLTWQGEGLRGFYKGLGPALIRVMPQSAVTLVVYENILQVLQDASSRKRT